MKYKVLGLGAKFNGKCVKCGSDTGAKDFEKAQTLLLKDDNGKFAVAHGRCCGKITSKVSGGKTFSGPDEFEA